MDNNTIFDTSSSSEEIIGVGGVVDYDSDISYASNIDQETGDLLDNGIYN